MQDDLWKKLNVCAIPPPVLMKPVGACIMNPVVTDGARLFIIRDVGAERPEPNAVIDEEEFRENGFIRLPGLPAQRRHCVIFRTRSFRRLLDFLCWQDAHAWIECGDGAQAAYANLEAIQQWKRDILKRICDRMSVELRRWLSQGFLDSHRMEFLRSAAQQGGYVSEIGTAEQREWAVLCGTYLRISDPSKSWAHADVWRLSGFNPPEYLPEIEAQIHRLIRHR